MLQVLIVDEGAGAGALFGDGIRAASDMELVACVTNTAEAMEFAGCFNIAILSATMPDDGTYELTLRLTQDDICASVIILTTLETQGLSLRMVEAGALAAVDRSATIAEALDIIRCVSRGEALLTPTLAGAMVARLTELRKMVDVWLPNNAGMAGLTRREREVLYLLSKDLSNQDIAQKLTIEVGTVKNHVHNILDKLKVGNRQEAASCYFLLNEKPYFALRAGAGPALFR